MVGGDIFVALVLFLSHRERETRGWIFTEMFLEEREDDSSLVFVFTEKEKDQGLGSAN